MTLTTVQRRERSRIILWAKERLADPRTVFLDTETTGIGSDAEIIDLAVVDIAGHVLIDTLVFPVQPVPAESTKVHGLTDADLAGAPSWPEVFPMVAALLAERTIVVYNADFDRRMITGSCATHGLMAPDGEWHCAMRAYAEYAGQRSPHRHRRFRYHKLGDALGTFGLPAGNHRALGDALACRGLVLALAEVESPVF